MLKDNIKSVNTWYLIYTKLKQEKVAQTNLKCQGYRIFLPFTRILRRYQARYQMITEPTFPRYLFICLNSTTDNWAPIRSTRGVISLVRFGGIPAKVPDRLIDFLMENERNTRSMTESTPEFKPGENVQILDGVMAGYQGIFEAKTGAKRVTVLLDIVNKTMKVEVPIDSVGVY